MSQKYERIPLAGRVGFRSEEGKHELRGVWDEMFVFAIDGVHGEDCIFADVGVPML